MVSPFFAHVNGLLAGGRGDGAEPVGGLEVGVAGGAVEAGDGRFDGGGFGRALSAWATSRFIHPSSYSGSSPLGTRRVFMRAYLVAPVSALYGPLSCVSLPYPTTRVTCSSPESPSTKRKSTMRIVTSS